MSTFPSIDQHPDIVALRAGYGRAAESVSAQGTFGLTMLGALYTAVSPWIVGFNATTALAVNDLIIGIAVAGLAFGFGAALDRTHGMTWIVPVLGIWLIISPWILRDVSLSAGMIWSNVVSGGALAILGIGAGYFGVRARNLDGH